MSVIRGVQDENGHLVKALPSGQPVPLNSRLAPLFQEAGVNTLPGALKYAADLYADKECMATRKLIQRHYEEKDGKKLEKLELGDYTWRTFREVQTQAEAVGSSVHQLKLKYGDKIGIFAETRAEWFIAAMGCLQQRVAVCTIYSTLSNNGIIHAINETEVQILFTSFDLIPRISKILGNCPRVTTIIVMEDQVDTFDTTLVPQNVKVIPFKEFSSEKNIIKSASDVVPKPNDIAIIMYTSGSTGTPKGVELTHGNILGSVVAYSMQVDVGMEDRYLAFLPLAHIMELATEVALVSLGATIYYSSPHTLTSTGPKVYKGCIGDAKIAKPTTMNCVPLLLDRIIKGVSQAVARQGWIKSTIFNSAVAYKFWIDYIPLASMFLDFIIFQKVKNELGGELRRVIVGGAPLSPQTQDTFRAIFGCTIQVGYGCTETASCGAGMNIDDYKTGHTGGPCLNIYIKLVDWAEGNYRTNDMPYPRGEILIGGPCVAKGYFKLPNETENSFFEEGGMQWFRTGDIAEIDNYGCLKIIDRKKDLVKLKHGEYISLGSAESLLKTMNVVDNMCIFADSTRDQTVAVIVPVLDVLRSIAAAVGIKDPNLTLEQLCEEEKVIDAVLKELRLHGRRCGLSRWEIPAAVHLTNELWTPDTGLVTAAMKLRRTQLGQQYRAMVLDMYSRLQD